MSQVSTTRKKALELLGSGISASQTASALGVSASRISQLLAEAPFQAEVTAKRVSHLQENTQRDRAYDTLEDRLLDKLDEAIPLLYKPIEILAALKIVNSAQRRASDQQIQPQEITETVALILPKVLVQQFTTSITNQVVKVGDAPLITIQSDVFSNTVKKHSHSHEQLTYNTKKQAKAVG